MSLRIDRHLFSLHLRRQVLHTLQIPLQLLQVVRLLVAASSLQIEVMSPLALVIERCHLPNSMVEGKRESRHQSDNEDVTVVLGSTGNVIESAEQTEDEEADNEEKDSDLELPSWKGGEFDGSDGAFKRYNVEWLVIPFGIEVPSSFCLSTAEP